MKPIHWLRFYRKPLTHLGVIALFSFLTGHAISILLTQGPEPLMLFFLGTNVLGVFVYSLTLYKWRKQFLQWKFQSFQSGGNHSSSEYDDSKYKERFDRQ